MRPKFISISFGHGVTPDRNYVQGNKLTPVVGVPSINRYRYFAFVLFDPSIDFDCFFCPLGRYDDLFGSLTYVLSHHGNKLPH